MYLCIIRKVHPFLLRKEKSFCVRKIPNHYTEYYSVVVIASPGKQFRVSAAKIVSSAEGASTLGRSGGMRPWEILKFGFSKMHILCILREM